MGYVENHSNKFKARGTGQSWFPKIWTSKDIEHTIRSLGKLLRIRKSILMI